MLGTQHLIHYILLIIFFLILFDSQISIEVSLLLCYQMEVDIYFEVSPPSNRFLTQLMNCIILVTFSLLWRGRESENVKERKRQKEKWNKKWKFKVKQILKYIVKKKMIRKTERELSFCPLNRGKLEQLEKAW